MRKAVSHTMDAGTPIKCWAVITWHISSRQVRCINCLIFYSFILANHHEKSKKIARNMEKKSVSWREWEAGVNIWLITPLEQKLEWLCEEDNK